MLIKVTSEVLNEDLLHTAHAQRNRLLHGERKRCYRKKADLSVHG